MEMKDLEMEDATKEVMENPGIISKIKQEEKRIKGMDPKSITDVDSIVDQLK